MYAINMIRPVKNATMTTAGLIPHRHVMVKAGEQLYSVQAPVKLAITDPANGLQAPALRGKRLVFALPGGKELEVVSWL